MKKVTFEYYAGPDEDFPERDVKIHAQAETLHTALWDIAQEIFRPARKHGYPDPTINKQLDKCGEEGIELIWLLEKAFHGILEEKSINLDL